MNLYITNWLKKRQFLRKSHWLIQFLIVLVKKFNIEYKLLTEIELKSGQIELIVESDVVVKFHRYGLFIDDTDSSVDGKLLPFYRKPTASIFR